MSYRLIARTVLQQQQQQLCYRWHSVRSLGTITTNANQHAHRLAFAFDIDGVLLKGSKVLPEGVRALQFVNGNNPLGIRLPHILLTNGGGVTEVEKAQQLSDKFNVKITADNLVLAHSPMRSLVDRYADKLILVVGGEGESCKRVAHQYGFRRVAQPNDIFLWNPSIWPFKTTNTWLPEEHIDFAKEPIHAIMMFHDGRDWGTELQVIMDVLLAKNGYIGTQRSMKDLSPQIPIYFSNPDLLWSNDFPVSRYAQGAFRVALEALYERITGRKLEYTLFGKPETVTYKYAEELLHRQLASSSVGPTESLHVYAIGDNPASDIAGAYNYGWNSILVRTGVFRDEDNGVDHSATHVATHVEDAVKWAFAREYQQ
ncbi:HAD-like domain-containing protein [Syncephalis plumigaleata]|nr:HAD-like domain-containing protein [Syncephalis plumigaleata]